MNLKPEVLAFITEYPRCQTVDIVRQLKLPSKDVCSVVRALLKDGTILSSPGPHYKTGKRCPCLIAYSTNNPD